MLDTIEERSFIPARHMANAFEVIKKEFFMNRAALKMANINAIFNHMFTQPKCLQPVGKCYDHTDEH